MLVPRGIRSGGLVDLSFRYPRFFPVQPVSISISILRLFPSRNDSASCRLIPTQHSNRDVMIDAFEAHLKRTGSQQRVLLVAESVLTHVAIVPASYDTYEVFTSQLRNNRICSSMHWQIHHNPEINTILQSSTECQHVVYLSSCLQAENNPEFPQRFPKASRGLDVFAQSHGFHPRIGYLPVVVEFGAKKTLT